MSMALMTGLISMGIYLRTSDVCSPPLPFSPSRALVNGLGKKKKNEQYGGTGTET